MAKVSEKQMSYIKAWNANPKAYNAARREVKGRGRTYNDKVPF